MGQEGTAVGFPFQFLALTQTGFLLSRYLADKGAG